MASFKARFKKPRTFVYFGIVILLAWGGYQLWFAPKSKTYDLATVKRGTLTQIVSVTGNTVPIHDVDLAFQTGGTVAVVNADVGAAVNAGDVIARLDSSDLAAQLAEARANADAQTAKLKSLQAGSRPEDIAAAQASLNKAKQDLANMYSNIPSTLLDGYAKANDAVRNQISPFFYNAETPNPQLTFNVNDSQVLNDIVSQRVQASGVLNQWQSELSMISASSPTSTLEASLQNGVAHLGVVANLLTTAGQALLEQSNLSASTLATYKNDLATALTEINGANTGVSGAAQSIASQKLTIAGLQASLNKTVAGPTAEDIAAQQAQVEQAQAAVQAIQAQLAKASLVAPVAGTITKQDAKVGEIASPGVVLVSIISNQGLEVDANIAEADIGKVSIGNNASMTLDAFQGRTFTGNVTYIDPGETVVEGVPTYKTKFMFDLTPDVKPGMTANIDITTATHTNVLSVPQRAVITDADGNRTVQVYHGNGQPLEKRSVTVGIRDTNGNIEITSGLNEGDQVLRTPQ